MTWKCPGCGTPIVASGRTEVPTDHWKYCNSCRWRHVPVLITRPVFRMPLWQGFYGPHEFECMNKISSDSCSCSQPPAIWTEWAGDPSTVELRGTVTT